MTRLNRAAAYILAIALVVAGLLLGLGQFALPGPYTLTAYNGQQFIFSHLAGTDELLNGIIGGVLALLGIFLLAAELLGPPTRQHLPLQGLSGATASVDRQSVEERLASVLQHVSGVQQARLRVRHQGKAVDVDAHLVAHPEQPVPTLCEQAQALIGHTLEHDLGLLPGDVQIRVRLAQPQASTDPAAAV